MPARVHTDSTGSCFLACLGLHEPASADPWAAPAAWAGLDGSAAPGKGSWVQLSLRQLLAAGGTQSISSLLQFK